MDVQPGDVVAVQGIGGLGHLALQFSKAMGFRTVALSSSGSKEEMAHKLGATDYVDGSKQVDALQDLGGAKVVVCTAPNSKVIENLIGGPKVGGKLLILGLPEGPATVRLGKYPNPDEEYALYSSVSSGRSHDNQATFHHWLAVWSC